MVVGLKLRKKRKAAPGPDANPMRNRASREHAPLSFRAPSLVREPPSWVLREAQDELESARTGGNPDKALERVLRLVELFPESEALQTSVARVLEIVGSSQAAQHVWTGIVGRFPHWLEAYRFSIKSSVRVRGHAAVLNEVKNGAPQAEGNLSSQIRLAVALSELGETASASELFKSLIREYPNVEAVWIECCRFLIAQKDVYDAHSTLRRAVQIFPEGRWLRQNLKEVEASIAGLEILAPRFHMRNEPVPERLLEVIMNDFQAERASTDRTSPPFLGSIALIGASLGAGGAERQLTNTATALKAAIDEGTRLGGRMVLGPLNLLVRSLDPSRKMNFFLDQVRDAGVNVIEYGPMRDSGLALKQRVGADFRVLLKYLPAGMGDGLTKLTDWLTWEAPSTVQLWQDGTIYTTVLAAIAARVPRIVLSLRTLPPIDRPDRMRQGHEILYRALARMPGVTFTTNTLVAARSLERWLDLPSESVHAVPNGVVPPSAEGRPESQEAMTAFENRTAGATFTLGCAMRMDANKRPLEWVAVAADVLERVPTSRFIVVGDGHLLQPMRDFVERRKIGHRFLFTGAVQDVGFWLHCMSVLMLLSRHEGLPNILLEAQSAGVPVIATPAGGVAEAIQHGVTGELIDGVEKLDVPQVASQIEGLAKNPERLATMGRLAKTWATRFSVSNMVHKTAELLV
jgi:glycosyltransferase involved in cell wall biosynthesis